MIMGKIQLRFIILFFIVFLTYRIDCQEVKLWKDTAFTTQIDQLNEEVNDLSFSITNNLNSNDSTITNIVDLLSQKSELISQKLTAVEEYVFNDEEVQQRVGILQGNINSLFVEYQETIDDLKDSTLFSKALDIIHLKDKVLQKGIFLLDDVYMNQEKRDDLLKTPVDVNEICELYNIDNKVYNILFNIEDSDTIQGKKIEKVTKGYSPFTNVYQDFIFFADSLESKEGGNKDTLGIVKRDILPTTAYSAIIEEDSVVFDSLYQIATSDSLFPHQLVRRFDKESLKKYWRIYRQQWNTPVQQEDDDLIVKADNIVSSESKVNASNVSDQEQLEPDIPTIGSSDEEEIISHAGKLKEDNATTENLGLYYVVQIAASRDPISDKLLKSLYADTENIRVIEEEDWYKYQIVQFEDYQRALKVKNELRVKGAFVVAYKNKEKQILWKTINWKKFTKQSSNLRFYVQVSASRSPMPLEQKIELEKKIGGFLREIEEEDWYKYQLEVGASYPEAVLKWKQVGSAVSFLVAYYNNKKINMIDAIKMYKDNKTK